MEYYFPYIKMRMEQEPEIYIKKLWKELIEKGYNKSYSTFSESLIYYDIRVGKKADYIKLPKHIISFFKPSRMAMLFITTEEKLTSDQKIAIEKVCATSKDAAVSLSLTGSFIQMMKTKQGNLLKDWINKAINSEIYHFAKSLLSEYQSIENAISLPWSNGPVEGFVNKLKTIKRQMYGRASFELLRRRMILNCN